MVASKEFTCGESGEGTLCRGTGRIKRTGRFGGAPTHGLSWRAVTNPKPSRGSVGMVFLEPAHCWLHEKRSLSRQPLQGGQRRKNKCRGLSLQSPSRLPLGQPTGQTQQKVGTEQGRGGEIWNNQQSPYPSLVIGFKEGPEILYVLLVMYVCMYVGR